MKSMNEEHGYDEVTVTRDEMAQVMAEAFALMCKMAHVPKDMKPVMKDFLATYGAFVMVKLFDENKIEKLEIE